MSYYLKIFGGGWALVGVAIIVESLISAIPAGHLFDRYFGLAVPVFGVLFVFPGLVIFGIGVFVGRRKAARDRNTPGESRGEH